MIKSEALTDGCETRNACEKAPGVDDFAGNLLEFLFGPPVDDSVQLVKIIPISLWFITVHHTDNIV